MNTEIKVVCQDGEVGILHEAIMNPKTLQPTYLIVLRTTSPQKTLRVHVHSVVNVSDNKIVLNKSMESLDFLTHYQLDNPLIA